MKFRQAKKILFNNGYNRIVPTRSSHVKFYNDKNGLNIVIPYHTDFNDMIWRRLVKEFELTV